MGVIKKGLIAGVIILIVGLLINQLLGMLFPSISQEYQNIAIFRPWNDPLMMVYFAYPFVLGLVFAYFWNTTGKQFTGNTSAKKDRHHTRHADIIRQFSTVK